MFDVIIIGSGPAGITASVYIKRAGFDVLVISNNNSALNKTDKIENYYGFSSPISGRVLQENGISQAKNLGVKILESEVTGIKYIENGDFEVLLANQAEDKKYQAKIIVIATGVNRNQPDIKGIKEFEGRGVSYCAVCDAPFYRGKDVAVLGNGNYALREIEELLPIAQNITMLTNGKPSVQLRADIDVNKEKIKEVRGSNKLEKIEFENGMTKQIDGLFVAQGIASSIDFAKKIGAEIKNNNIVVNDNMETTVNNIYACGDCTGGIYQISKAVYQGMKAGLEIIKKLREENKNE